MTAAWGSSYLFIAIALRSFGPAQISFLRLLLGSIVLGALLIFLRVPLLGVRESIPALVVAGISGIAIPFVFVAMAQQHVSSSLTAVLATMTPVFVYAGAVFLGQSRLNLNAVLGVLISFLGVGVLHWVGLVTQRSQTLWQLAIVGCCVFLAIANLTIRTRLLPLHSVLVVFMQFACSIPPVGAYMIMQEGIPRWPQNDLPAVFAVLQLSVVSSAVAYALFAYLIKRWGSALTSTNTYLQPIVGCGLGVIVLGERMSAWEWFGSILIVAGVVAFAAGTFARGKRLTGSGKEHMRRRSRK